MAASITSSAQMGVDSSTGVLGNLTGGSLSTSFASQPQGHLEIKNETTGVEKTYKGKELVNLTNIWNQASDDPSYSVGDVFTVTYSGRADGLTIANGSNVIDFTGNGHGEVTLKAENAGGGGA